jgi:nucleoside-diphosphate-sugar epimerase
MGGDGRTLNHPVYVGNLVDVFELIADNPVAKGRVYLAGDDEPVSLSELVRAVGAAVGSNVRIIRFPWYQLAWFGAGVVEVAFKTMSIKPPVFRRRLSWFKTNRAFRIDRAKKELGYQPRVRLREGLLRTANWYRQAGYLTSLTQLTAFVL